MVAASSEKIFQIDDHIGVVAAGLLADARVLANQARVRAQINRITYEEPIDTWGIARLFGDRMQISTLYAGLRPFGVTLIVGGVDKTGTHLIESDPSGMLFEWNAYAIGRGAILANKILKQRWKKDMQEKDAIELAVDVITKTEKEKKEGSIDLAVIKKDGKFRKLSEDEVRKLSK